LLYPLAAAGSVCAAAPALFGFHGLAPSLYTVPALETCSALHRPTPPFFSRLICTVPLAVAASSYLPFWSSPELYTEVRQFEAYDGGFTDPLPCPPPGE
jgi:hypothetical protein